MWAEELRDNTAAELKDGLLIPGSGELLSGEGNAGSIKIGGKEVTSCFLVAITYNLA